MAASGTNLVGGDSPSESPLQIGQIVAGKYRIERQIGRGGMGIVLAATHLQLEHLVAIKVMRRDLLEDDQALNRLLIEARAAARIRSEHVARVLDVGTLESGSPFIVMEYLEGEDLADLLDRRGALEVEQAVTFMLQSCEALAEVHVAEMVHRDLKPGNLFIAQLPDGSPTLKIVDFGISKYIGGAAREGAATTSPQVLGSPFYMAPEQMRADAVDERSDIWGLGAILFEMLTGRPPFIGETLPEVYAAVLNDAPPPIESLRSGAPQGLDDVVQRCLAKDPAQRFCDVADLAEALAPFGGPASALSVERITRILTNPEPIRARYSSIPAPPGSMTALEAAVDSCPGESASQPLVEAQVYPSPARLPSDEPDAEAWPLRASRTGAELHPLSATGVEGQPRRKARVAWSLTAAFVAGLGAVWWMRSLSPGAAGGVEQRTGTASSVELSSPASPGAEPGVAHVASEAERSREFTSEAASSGAGTRTEKKALRAAPRPSGGSRPFVSGVSFRSAGAAKKKPVAPQAARASAPSEAPVVDEESAKRREATAPPREEAPVDAPAPQPHASPREARSADPWDPSSFGDRR